MCNRVAQRPAPVPTPSVSQPTPSVSNPTPTPQQGQGGSIEVEWGRMTINFGNNAQSPTSYCPAPNPSYSSAPAGQGLTKNSDGSVTTAGGYKIIPEGKDSAFKIMGPDGKELTRVWGDPHVKEGDGTKWDFTKDSNFVLPDGTRIGVDTTSQTGKSVTQALDIANGNDRVQMSGINTNRPQTGEVTRDGMTGWQAANGTGRDTFSLRHDANNQDWVKHDETGKLHGVITGAKYENDAYQQITNGTDSRLGGVGATPAPGQLGAPTPQNNAFGLQQLFQMLGLGQFSGLGMGNQLGWGNSLGMGASNPWSPFGNFGSPMAFNDPFGLGGWGGLGQNGMSPYRGYEALTLLQGLMQESLRAQQMQIEYGRLRANFR